MSAAARAQAKSAQINPNWPHYASAALTVAVLIGSFLRWGLLGTLFMLDQGRSYVLTMLSDRLDGSGSMSVVLDYWTVE